MNRCGAWRCARLGAALRSCIGLIALIRSAHLIPAGLELDTFDNAAWIGLVPFEIFDCPGIPHFPETNLRTYVVGPDGTPAVWFFSLEAARVLAVIGARLGYHLPYFWAKMAVSSENGVIHYQSRRHWPHDPHAITDIRVHPGELFEPGELSDLDHFLTARFQLYAASGENLHRAQIDHAPWPLARGPRPGAAPDVI